MRTEVLGVRCARCSGQHCWLITPLAARRSAHGMNMRPGTSSAGEQGAFQQRWTYLSRRMSVYGRSVPPGLFTEG